MGQSTITVVFFAQLREIMSESQLQFEITQDNSTTVSQVIDCLKDEHEIFKKYIDQGNQIVAAVNHNTVDLDTILVEGDELALFPPVTGG